LRVLSNETISVLSEFACVPLVTKDVPFEQKDPELRLYLAGNPLQRIPGALFNLEHLTVLSLRGCGLKEVPQMVHKLRNLESLNLSFNSLRYLPAEVLDLVAAPGKVKVACFHPNPFYQPKDDAPVVATPEEQMPAAESPSDLHHEPVNVSPVINVPRSVQLCTESPGTSERLLFQYTEAGYQSIGARFSSRSPVQFSDTAGLVYSHFNIDLDKSQEISGNPLIETEQSSHADSNPLSAAPNHSKLASRGSNSTPSTRVPSLVEAVLRTCYRSPSLKQFPECLQGDDFLHLRELLEKAIDAKETGGLVCSLCRRHMIVPTTQWIEWWELAKISRELSRTPEPHPQKLCFEEAASAGGERLVPFIRKGCSWKCLPTNLSIGRWLTRDDVPKRGGTK
jgi:hypothetical protein